MSTYRDDRNQGLAIMIGILAVALLALAFLV